MTIAGLFSFKGGKEVIEARNPAELAEVRQIIEAVDAGKCRTKISREQAMAGRTLYSPRSLNGAFRRAFSDRGWEKRRVRCEYASDYYVPGHVPSLALPHAFREMDFVKNRVGVEVQFGKYAFMVYNVCAKMTIFHNIGVIDAGIEIVPIKTFADQMSTGVAFFEQLVWDLEHRGIADIDIPVLVFGVTE